MVDKIIELLVKFGLKRDDSKQLAEKINNMYIELEREKQRERGRKGARSGTRIRNKEGRFVKSK